MLQVIAIAVLWSRLAYVCKVVNHNTLKVAGELSRLDKKVGTK